MDLDKKLSILADAAKYDASCSSSGSQRKNAGRRLGNAAPAGICHSYTEDGRCVSLLKILYTNHCIYDCAYCINRISNDIPRAAFTSREIVRITIDFYRRNYIEGLFLSSGIIRSPDDTMERLIETVRRLRHEAFNGYIHLKCVPHASRRLIQAAGRYADRLSVNIELPSESSLKRLTHEKSYASILGPMDVIRDTLAESRDDLKRGRQAPEFAPAGQSTQLIVGASPESDYDILYLADRLYRQQSLRRVYYSAYIPLPVSPVELAAVSAPPLARENRLYQSDWLMRLYGFSLDEVISKEAPQLDLAVDPKQASAMRRPELFPVDLNTADREMVLRVPGIGIRSANRIVRLRRLGRIRFEHLKQMGVVIKRARPFIVCDGLGSALHALPMSLEPAAEPGDCFHPDPTDEKLSPQASARIWVTDGSFEGLLTAIFDAYRLGRTPDDIQPSGRGQLMLFDSRAPITTDPAKAERTWKGLEQRIGARKRRQLHEAFLSESPGKEMMILRYVEGYLPNRKNPTGQSADDPVSTRLTIEKLARKVRREAHRLKGFVRFRQFGEDRFIALINPRYDVLPLVRQHFEARFADQKWIIYDTNRHYGLSWDTHSTREVRLDVNEITMPSEGVSPEENLYQTLWQRYYAAANIGLRKNPALHLRMLPRRFWRYLPEKKIPS